tara:strand:+ start:11250 stop:11435 length:186 start_codon:yes stop_codon:yes gene_type:complete
MIGYSDHKQTIGDILNSFPHMDFQEAFEYSEKLGCKYKSYPQKPAKGTEDPELEALFNSAP